ncbi:GvpL/GvpF family gas vesicle protein [Streptomyces panaciradicis]|uniref:GvpL/GvpF family gas vesicle protein n=1 Tax=Streptomyces panaciradicis TaxID=1470261 RepID=UPI0027E43F58|nr:GvpL/GvpF family gas vesicle protein [Streptomyces panaciradicis]
MSPARGPASIRGTPADHRRARRHAELRRYAVAATRHRPQSEQLTGRNVPQLLNAAYLVDDGRRAEFVRAVGRLAREALGSAVQVTMSGPWVPYSFARPDEVECGAYEELRA